MLLQFLINGLITGSLITLGSLGFALVYNTTRIFHVSYAVLFVAAAYFFWQFNMAWHWPVLVAILTSTCLTGILSLSVEKLIYYPLANKRASLNIVFLASIGVFIILTNVVAMLWGNETKVFSADISAIHLTGQLFITSKQLVQIVTALLVLSAFFLLLNFSRSGLHIKALKDDPELYRVLGFNIVTVRGLVFIGSGVLVAIPACLIAWDTGLNPHFGMAMLINSIVALIVGGVGRFKSCIIGGMLLGLIQALLIWQWSVQWQEAGTFIVLLIFLFLRPSGFIGEKSRVV